MRRCKQTTYKSRAVFAFSEVKHLECEECEREVQNRLDSYCAHRGVFFFSIKLSL